MQKIKHLWFIGVLLTVTAVFFYKTILFGFIPFPGDGLVSDFQPWRSESYLGYAAGGIPNKAQYPDTYRQLYPWKTLVIRSLKQGKLPLWNPYNFSGAPLLANFQSAALYPLNLCYLLFSQTTSWSILVILQPLLAALFTYLYMKQIKSSGYAAVLSAVSYGFSGFMSVWLEYNTIGHVILWLPLILLAIEHIRENKQLSFWFVVIALANMASVLAGHPQLYAYLTAFSVLYAILRLTHRSWVSVIGFSFLGIGMAGIQIIPGIELVSQAARSPHEFTNVFTKILIQPWQLISLAFPNFFGNPATRTYWPLDTFIGKVSSIGLVPLFFSLSALRRKDQLSRWYLCAAIFVVVAITANPITYVLYQIPISLFSSSSPTLMSFLLAFSLSVYSGLGLDYWISERHSIRKLISRTISVGILLLLLAGVTTVPWFTDLHAHNQIALRAILYGGLISGATLTLFWVAIAKPKWQKIALILLLIVHSTDLFVFFTRFNPFVSRVLVFPDQQILSYLMGKSPDRYWGYGTAGIPANFAAQYGFFSPEGYDPLYPKRYGEFIYTYKHGAIMSQFTGSTRSDAAITAGFGKNGLSDANTLRIIDLLSVRYILDRTENGSTGETFPPDRYQTSLSYKDWHIFENTKAAPRVYFATTIVPYDSKEDFSRKIFAPTFDPSSMVLTKEVPIGLEAHSDIQGDATITSYAPESVTIRTKRPTAGLLVLTDTDYPGWNASIDGKPTHILPANWTFRAIVVPSGVHTIVMTYQPASIAVGVGLSIISSIVTLGIFLLLRKKRA